MRRRNSAAAANLIGPPSAARKATPASPWSWMASAMPSPAQDQRRRERLLQQAGQIERRVLRAERVLAAEAAIIEHKIDGLRAIAESPAALFPLLARDAGEFAAGRDAVLAALPPLFVHAVEIERLREALRLIGPRGAERR